jgi:hypothetical protein
MAEIKSDAEWEALKAASTAAHAWDGVEHGWFEEGWLAGRAWQQDQDARALATAEQAVAGMREALVDADAHGYHKRQCITYKVGPLRCDCWKAKIRQALAAVPRTAEAGGGGGG